MPRIRPFAIDFNKADGYAVTRQDILREKLTPRGLFGPQFGYSAFKAELIPLVLTTGTFHREEFSRRNDMDCCAVDHPQNPGLVGIYHNADHGLDDYLDRGEDMAFAVYDLSHLKERVVNGQAHTFPYFSFKDPDNKLDALRAVVNVRWD